MNTSNTDKNNFVTENKNRLLFLFLLFLLSSIGMFGQTANEGIEVKENSEVICFDKNDDVASLNSQIDFVSWFMGTKQSQMIDGTTSKKSVNGITKKQILFQGITPNKVLYRTFMKKVSSQDNAIV